MDEFSDGIQEPFKKFRSHAAGGRKDRAVFLSFGFVSAQSQSYYEPAPRSDRQLTGENHNWAD